MTPVPTAINTRPTTNEMTARDFAKLGPTDDLLRVKYVRNLCFRITLNMSFDPSLKKKLCANKDPIYLQSSMSDH